MSSHGRHEAGRRIVAGASVRHRASCLVHVVEPVTPIAAPYRRAADGRGLGFGLQDGGHDISSGVGATCARRYVVLDATPSEATAGGDP
jgi:hypothetical protein